MSDFLSSPAWWAGLVLFGGMLVFSVLEWRGTVRTPFERIWPANALGSAITAAPWVAGLLALPILDLLDIRFRGLPFFTPALVVLLVVGITAAGLILAFRRRPPRWAVPRRLRPQDEGDQRATS